MRLNKSTNDAIQILIECARAEGTLVKVADLSIRLNITMQNIFKIVHILSRANLLAPVRGRYGGVGLKRPAAEIRIGEVVRAMETMGDKPTAAASREKARVGKPNPMAIVIDSALEAFISVLDQHSLADMAHAAVPRSTTSPRRRAASRLHAGKQNLQVMPPTRLRPTE